MHSQNQLMCFKNFLLPALLLLFILPAAGQGYQRAEAEKLADSLRRLPEDTAQVMQLCNMGNDLTELDSALSKQLLEEALAKSLKIKESKTIATCYRLLGLWYGYYNDNVKNYNSQQLSFEWAKKGDHLYMMAGALFNMGNVQYWKGQYDSCIHFYLRAADIFEDPRLLKDKNVTEKQVDRRKSDLYSNLSSTFNTLKNLRKADEYIDKAIAIAKKYDSPAAADALAYYMQQKADNYKENGNVEKALEIRLAFLPQMEKRANPNGTLQTAYQNISQEYFDLKKIDSSLLYAGKSLQVATTLRNAAGVANANWQLGRIAMLQKNYAQADKYLETAKAYYEKSEDPAEQSNYYDVMRQLSFEQGRFKDAYLYFNKYNTAKDSLLNSKRAKDFEELEARYQSDKKEAQLQLRKAELKQRNNLVYFLGGAVALLCVVLFLSFRNYAQKQKLQQQRISELETEKQLAATESVLKGEEQERTRLAKDLHDGLGGMLSGIKFSLNNMKGNLVMTPENAQAFERSMDMLDSSIKEMRRVAHNMMPEALVKFGLDTALKDFCNDINQSGALKISYQSIGIENTQLEQTASITVYRIVQELINNTIKHAGAQTAIVQVSKRENQLSVTVEDDGKGFDAVHLQQAKGLGWTNIKSRVEFLKGILDVQSDPGKGTSVHIEFNI